jgi:V8-like Glu-specific endopeptidase
MEQFIYDCICLVECGTASGTAFLINSNTVLTAFHVISECGSNTIKLNFTSKAECCNASYLEKDPKLRELDIALLSLDVSLHRDRYLELVNRALTAKQKWITRGYPAAKKTTGENLQSDKNQINQILPTLQKNKIDLQLDFDMKLTSYKGLSGAPVIIDDYVVGIINEELNQNGSTREISALSVKHFEPYIISPDIQIKTIEECPVLDIESKSDVSAHTLWSETTPTDIRNITEKLQAVCNEMSTVRINRYTREVAAGKVEQEQYNAREISAMKYRIFDVCQGKLIDFIEGNGHPETLTTEEVDKMLNDFTDCAVDIILTRGKDYNYPFSNRDSLRKIVLNLIDECFLSFDKNGIYETS